MSEDKELNFCVDCIYCSNETKKFTCDNPSFSKPYIDLVTGSRRQFVKLCSDCRSSSNECGIHGDGFIRKSRGVLRWVQICEQRYKYIYDERYKSIYSYMLLSKEDKKKIIMNYIKTVKKFRGYLNKE